MGLLIVDDKWYRLHKAIQNILSEGGDCGEVLESAEGRFNRESKVWIQKLAKSSNFFTKSNIKEKVRNQHWLKQ